MLYVIWCYVIAPCTRLGVKVTWRSGQVMTFDDLGSLFYFYMILGCTPYLDFFYNFLFRNVDHVEWNRMLFEFWTSVRWISIYQGGRKQPPATNTGSQESASNRVNARLTRWGIWRAPPVFSLNSCQTYRAINTCLSVPFEIPIWYPIYVQIAIPCLP